MHFSHGQLVQLVDIERDFEMCNIFKSLTVTTRFLSQPKPQSVRLHPGGTNSART